MNLHKNARLTPQGRALLVQRIRIDGWRVGDAAAAAGLSQRQAFRWLARSTVGAVLRRLGLVRLRLETQLPVDLTRLSSIRSFLVEGATMSNLFWLSDEQLAAIEAALPKKLRG